MNNSRCTQFVLVRLEGAVVGDLPRLLKNHSMRTSDCLYLTEQSWISDKSEGTLGAVSSIRR